MEKRIMTMENNSYQTNVQPMDMHQLGVAHDKLFDLLEAHHGESGKVDVSS